MSTSETLRFRALQRWSDTWWFDTGVCHCAAYGRGVRHHDVTCPYVGWAWEQKARDLLRGGEPDANPSEHLRP